MINITRGNEISLSLIHLGNILREAYRQGYLNGFADADSGSDDCDLEKLCDDWVGEVVADGFVGMLRLDSLHI